MIMKILLRLFPLLLGGAVLLPGAHAADGESLYKEECADCHSIREGKNKKGPSLWNVVGRKAASVADFDYSESLRNSGIVWTPDKISAYLENPKKLVPGGKMKYDGLPDPQDRQAIIDYLTTLR